VSAYAKSKLSIEHFVAEKNQESAKTVEAIQRLKELSPAL
jgi:hypothetical protein